MTTEIPLDLSEKELKSLNRRHIGSTDKWLRMFMGIASEVTDVADNIIYLQVVYSGEVKQAKDRNGSPRLAHVPGQYPPPSSRYHCGHRIRRPRQAGGCNSL